MTDDSVTLTQLELTHADATYRWLTRPEVKENLGLRHEPTLDRTKAFCADASVRDDAIACAILLGRSHVGNVVVDNLDRRNRKARLHIYIGESSARGRGVGKQAVHLALRAAFAHLPIDKVYLTVHTANRGAIAVYEACGFVHEGTHRKEFLLHNQLVDELYMGVLREEILG